MKKIISVFTVLLLFASYGLAEVNLDMEQYSIEDLVQLRAVIEEEINNRVGSATATLQPGKYVAGVDIAVDDYIMIGLMDKGPDGYTPQIFLAESIDDCNNRDYIDSAYLAEGENYRISLKEGMALKINSGNCAIQKAAPMLFAPD